MQPTTMIVKSRDAQPATIAALEERARRESNAMRRNGCLSAAARLRNDSTAAAACDLLDRRFGDATDWAVLHDLRLQVGRHVLHVNHLLINDYLEFVCIDSRYRASVLHQHADGRFEARSEAGARDIASPVHKAARDARMLRSAIAERRLLPRLFGIGPRASVKALVLIDPGGRLAPARTLPEGTDLVATDAVFALLWKQRRRRRGNPLERVSPGRLRRVAERLAADHRQNYSDALLEVNTASAA